MVINMSSPSKSSSFDDDRKKEYIENKERKRK
jgi:hypothetical protein